MPAQPATNSSITWGALAVIGGLLSSVVGGVIFLSTEIADAKAEAVREAKSMIVDAKQRADRDYASRSDVAVIGSKLDALVSTQRVLIHKINRERDAAPETRRGR